MSEQTEEEKKIGLALYNMEDMYFNNQLDEIQTQIKYYVDNNIRLYMEYHQGPCSRQREFITYMVKNTPVQCGRINDMDFLTLNINLESYLGIENVSHEYAAL